MTPREVLRTRVETYSELNRESPRQTLAGDSRSFDLNFGTGSRWRVRGFQLVSSRGPQELFDISGSIRVYEPNKAAAELRYHEQRTGLQLDLAVNTGIAVASTVLAHFMYENPDKPAEQAVTDFHACLARNLNGVVELPA